MRHSSGRDRAEMSFSSERIRIPEKTNSARCERLSAVWRALARSPCWQDGVARAVARDRGTLAAGHGGEAGVLEFEERIERSRCGGRGSSWAWLPTDLVLKRTALRNTLLAMLPAHKMSRPPLPWLEFGPISVSGGGRHQTIYGAYPPRRWVPCRRNLKDRR
jgi:hypothetical protein